MTAAPTKANPRWFTTAADLPHDEDREQSEVLCHVRPDLAGCLTVEVSETSRAAGRPASSPATTPTPRSRAPTGSPPNASPKNTPTGSRPRHSSPSSRPANPKQEGRDEHRSTDHRRRCDRDLNDNVYASSLSAASSCASRSASSTAVWARWARIRCAATSTSAAALSSRPIASLSTT